MATVEVKQEVAPSAPTAPPPLAPVPPPPARTRLFNSQLSQIEYIRRVVEEARDRSHPVLERLRFLAFSYMNLDEFFEVHVSGLRAQREGVQAGTAGLLPDGRTPSEALTDVEARLQPFLREQEAAWIELRRDLAERGIHLLTMSALDGYQREAARAYFEHEVFPVLTPLAVDPAHPFPHISHLSLSLAVTLEDPDSGQLFARLKIPPNLPRLVPVPPPASAATARTAEAADVADAADVTGVVDDGPASPHDSSDGHPPRYFVWLESLIEAHLEQLFPGVPVTGSYVFRVTRDYDQDIRERQGEDLLSIVQQSLRERFFGFVVRIECGPEMPESVRARLIEELEAPAAFSYACEPPLGKRDLMALYALDRPDLKYPPFVPRVPPPLTPGEDFFGAIRRRDIVLHHPFDSFAPVVQFVEAAAADLDVLAIKQTLYRVGQNSPIVDALMKARENNKQVAVLLELKARGDEENNIEWALQLEKAGVHVVYGIIGLKTHCKATLVVRREPDGIRRYVHLATGNYNGSTARQYTDVGVFTCEPQIGADLTDLFNYLTGYARDTRYRRVLVSPTTWRKRLVELIDREIASHAHGLAGRIIIKVNALTDSRIVDLLYRASQAGVKVDLIVRGMCCLRPGVPGLSENIRVVSIVGRFLEHSRIYYFGNGGDEEIFIGSADIMPRNLDRRVETVTPILDESWRAYLKEEILDLYLRDTARARVLQPDGSYLRLAASKRGHLVDAQAALLAAARG